MLVSWLEKVNHAILVYPRSSDRWSIVSMLLDYTDLLDYELYIITRDQDKIDSRREYQEIFKPQDLKNNIIVIIDNLNLLTEEIITDLWSGNAISLFLTTWGDDFDFIERIPDLSVLTLPLMSDSDMNEEIVLSDSSPLQIETYKQIRDPTHQTKISNYCYKVNRFDRVRDSDNILEELSLERLQDSSPKVYELLRDIVSHPEDRHVVLTNFSGPYGVKMISKLLNLAGVDVIDVSSDDSDKDKKFKRFEKISGRVLVTNLFSESGYRPVFNSLHILDTFNFDLVSTWIRKMYKNSMKTPIKVKYYLTRENEPDREKYLTYIHQREIVDKRYLQQFSSKDRIKIGPGYLEIEERI